MKKTTLAIASALTLFVTSCKEIVANDYGNGEKSESEISTESTDTLEFPANEIKMDPEEVVCAASDDGNMKIYHWNPDPNGFYGFETRCQIRGNDGKSKIVDLPFAMDGATVTKIYTIKKDDGNSMYLLEIRYRFGEPEYTVVCLKDDKMIELDSFAGEYIDFDEDDDQ